MVEVRNPWGRTEHNLAFNDADTSTEAKNFFNEYNHPNADDGLFWIQYSDFVANFDRIAVGYYLDEYKQSSQAKVYNHGDASTNLAWTFNNPVAQDVWVAPKGVQDRNFMDDNCEDERRVGHGYTNQRLNVFYFGVQNSAGSW
jgi:hypothetical protein